MTENYPWYSVAEDGELRQGDILFQCPVMVPTTSLPDDASNGGVLLDADVLTYDVVVMSQSCDLENEKLDLVLVCPHWSFEEFSGQQEYFKSRQGRLDLQRGNVPGYFLLNRYERSDLMADFRVVDFRNVYSLPFEFLKRFCGQNNPRLRLLPPYREHLSQAFARFFMRVGLPIPVDLNQK